jgi:hypothetical protein
MDNLKIDIINDAYSELRISGLTLLPSPEDTKLALRRLETTMHELASRNVCLNYNFEDSPDVNSTCGLKASHWYPISCILAFRLLSDFGKGMQPDAVLVANMQSGMSFLHSNAAQVRETAYPGRQPIGSGITNRFAPSNKYYQPVAEAPLSCATNDMVVGDVADFVEHFEAYLIDAEVISSFTIGASDGITVSASANTDTDVTYRITAVGNAGTKSDLALKIKIVITTDAGRKTTRIVYFSLTTETI